MVSRILDGAKEGTSVYLNWAGCTAREEHGDIIVSQDGNDFAHIRL